jgi:pimeloyl-ACP methyl ester carboxylesterase
VAHVPEAVLEAAAQPLHVRWRQWIENRRLLSARPPHRYPTLEDALARMMAENAHLSVEQARHLTVHGASRNEDGTYSWKFDNYVRSRPPADLSPEELHALWGRIACPMLLCWGRKSWALDPSDEAKHFADARVAAFDDAGHWLHHDQFDAFMSEVRAFI